jgi:hypothetical protein
MSRVDNAALALWFESLGGNIGTYAAQVRAEPWLDGGVMDGLENKDDLTGLGVTNSLHRLAIFTKWKARGAASSPQPKAAPAAAASASAADPVAPPASVPARATPAAAAPAAAPAPASAPAVLAPVLAPASGGGASAKRLCLSDAKHDQGCFLLDRCDSEVQAVILQFVTPTDTMRLAMTCRMTADDEGVALGDRAWQPHCDANGFKPASETRTRGRVPRYRLYRSNMCPECYAPGSYQMLNVRAFVCSLCKDCFVSVHKLAKWSDRKRALPRMRTRWPSHEGAINAMVHDIPEYWERLVRLEACAD